MLGVSLLLDSSRTFDTVNHSSNISNTRKSVSSDIQTLRSQSVWMSDEILLRVFDIASQSISNS